MTFPLVGTPLAEGGSTGRAAVPLGTYSHCSPLGLGEADPTGLGVALEADDVGLWERGGPEAAGGTRPQPASKPLASPAIRTAEVQPLLTDSA